MDPLLGQDKPARSRGFCSAQGTREKHEAGGGVRKRELSVKFTAGARVSACFPTHGRRLCAALHNFVPLCLVTGHFATSLVYFLRTSLPFSYFFSTFPTFPTFALRRKSCFADASPTHDTPLHPEVRSSVSLTTAHMQKIYFSGPLVQILHKNPDGRKPHKDDGWRNVWAQLYGTTLCIWERGEVEVEIANQLGGEVPPLYVNITEAVRSPFWQSYRRDSTKTLFPVR